MTQERGLHEGQPAVFKGVPLHKGRKCDVKIRREQFFRSLATNLRNWLLSLQSSNVSSTTYNRSSSEYDDLISNL